MSNATFGGVVQLVNRLQRACGALGQTAETEDLEGLANLWNLLPSLVAIGGQSSGKSSVMEAVVGTDFLPRGTGIVTRRPLLLQLVHLEDEKATPYGEFLHVGPRKFWSFDAIRAEIEAETARHLSRRRKLVSAEPIQLAIYSPHVPNLTMVDMPGLTKVPVDGQPKSIVRELEDMARTYIKGGNAIILAVTPANADLATSDALHLARQVDPSGSRTIGVLTKLDIMDPGTDARGILEGREVRLAGGWAAVVNRGQADIASSLPLAAARARELDFFRRSPAYSGLANVGTGHLTARLERHLLAAIQRQLPRIAAFVDAGIGRANKELAAMGGPVAESRGARVHLLLSLCRAFEDAYRAAIEGGKDGGERILQVFEVRLAAEVRRLDFAAELAPANVAFVIDTADGWQPHLVAPELGYRRLLRTCLAKFKGPGEAAVEEVHAVLHQIVERTLRAAGGAGCAALKRYPALRRQIAAAASAELGELRGKALALVSTMVEMEQSYLTAEVFREILASSHAVDELSQEAHRTPVLTLDGRTLADVIADGPEEERPLRVIAAHTSAYITHVRRQLKHTLPKAIVHCLVAKSKAGLLGKLEEEQIAGADPGLLSRLLEEDPGTAEQRARLRRRLALLQAARVELLHAGGG